MQKEKIKIICLIGQLGNGGSEKQLYLFLKYLDLDKFEPTVIVSSKTEGVWKKRIRDDIACRIISLGTTAIPLLKIITFKYLLYKIRPALVLSWSFHTNAFHILDFGSHKFIGSLRDQLSPAISEISYFHSRQSMSPDYFIVNSKLLEKELAAYGIPLSKISLIHNIFEPNTDFGSNAILSQRKSDIRKQHGISEDEILVAGTGRDSANKDFSFFVKVFAEASASNSKLKAILIGSGGLGVKDEISSSGLSGKFIITGEIPYAKDMLPCADIFFLSSKYEGMPNVLFEAIDAGCAILSMNVGGVKDILGDDNPHLKETVAGLRDVKEVSSMLSILAEDRELRTRISEYNRNFRLDNFTQAKIMPKYYQLFEKVLF